MTLTDDELEGLNAVSALPVEYPTWMQAMQTDREPGTPRDWEKFTKK